MEYDKCGVFVDEGDGRTNVMTSERLGRVRGSGGGRDDGGETDRKVEP